MPTKHQGWHNPHPKCHPNSQNEPAIWDGAEHCCSMGRDKVCCKLLVERELQREAE